MCKFANNGKHSRIDKCMKEEIEHINIFLNETKDRSIIACCCGHNRYSKTILVKDLNTEIGYNVWELFSKKEIPRYGNFYKTDKKGFYFLPEVDKEKG